MVSYTPNIPQPSDIPANSQDQILQNFQQLNISNSVNHVAYNDANQGKHKFVQMPEQLADPGTAANECAIYSKEGVGGSTQMYFQKESNGNVVQMTGTLPVVNAEGCSFLPGTYPEGSIIIQWGSKTESSSTTRSVTFPKTFSITPWSIQISPFRSGSGLPGSSPPYLFIDSTSITTSGFNIINQSSHSFGFYWVAIGSRNS